MPATATPVRTDPSPSTDLVPGPPVEPLVIDTTPPALVRHAAPRRSDRAWLVVVALLPAFALGGPALSVWRSSPGLPVPIFQDVHVAPLGGSP